MKTDDQKQNKALSDEELEQVVGGGTKPVFSVGVIIKSAILSVIKFLGGSTNSLLGRIFRL